MKAFHLTVAAATMVLASSVNAGNLVPNRTVNIKFNGFCDGMQLVINHATGVVSGSVLGCVSGRVIGTVGGNSGKGIGVTVMSRTFQYVIDDLAQTWQLYNSSGVLLQSGTWSLVAAPFAAPAAGGGVPTGQ